MNQTEDRISGLEVEDLDQIRKNTKLNTYTQRQRQEMHRKCGTI